MSCSIASPSDSSYLEQLPRIPSIQTALQPIDDVMRGIPSMMCTYSPGGSVLNHAFIWRVPDDYAVDAALLTSRLFPSLCVASLLH